MASVSVSPVPEGDGDSSGEFVLKKLFAEFVVVGDRKIQHACSQPLEYSLAKGLLRGEDAQFDQVLTLSGVCSQLLDGHVLCRF
jgi:hypothetical protein